MAQAGYHSNKRTLSQSWSMVSEGKTTAELFHSFLLAWRWPHLWAAPVVSVHVQG